MKRFLCMLITVIMVLGMVPMMSFAEEFDTENFVGMVLTVADSSLTVEMYKGITSQKTKMTPVHTEGNAYYFEVATGSYCYIAKPVSGNSHYSVRKNFYITAEDAKVKTVWDVTPPERTNEGWDPKEIWCYADVVMEKAFPSTTDLWPDYKDLLTTPALTIPRTEHQMTTQEEMMAYINDLDDAQDDMYLFNLGMSGGSVSSQLDIPVVFYTKTDLSGASTWQDAAELIRANGKLTVMYQAQIHGNEPAAGESALSMLKAFDGSYGDALTENMNICVMPRLNTWGASNAIRYVYINGAEADPNRDFLRLRSEEVRLRTVFYQHIEPEICFDTHEYQLRTGNVTVDMQDMQLSTNFSVKSTEDFQNLALTLCYEAFDRAEENGLGYGWYSDSVTGYNANIGTSNVAYRGSLVFLTETNGIYGGNQQLARRMMGHISMVTGILDYVKEHTAEVQKVVDDQRAEIVNRGKTYEESDVIVLKTDSTEHPEHYINGQKIHTASGVISDEVFTGHIYDVVSRSRIAPTAYVIPAGESWTSAVLEKLALHGIAYTKIPAGSAVQLQQYIGTVTEADLTEEKAITFPQGAYVMTMAQEDAYILALLMEPDVDDLAEHKGTFVQDGLIPVENEIFPIYRYIQDLNEDDFIDYTVASAAPTGLTGEGATTIGGTGKITGLNATKSYEYRAAGEAKYTAVTAGATEITDLPLGNYLVRYASAQGGLPSADAAITVGYNLDQYIVYVDSANGSKANDAYTEATATTTYSLAKAQLDLLMEHAPAGTTGEIRLIGTYKMTKSSTGELSLQSHDYPLLISGGTLIYTDNANERKWLHMGGDTTFDNITLKIGTSSAAYFLCAEGHKLTIGPNVTTVANGSYYFNIMGGNGGYGNTYYTDHTDVTILSGTWRYVYAGGYVSSVVGDAKIKMSNCSVARVGGSHNGRLDGNLYMELDNVTIRDNVLCAGNYQKNNISGNVTMVLGAGMNVANIYAGSKTAGNIGGTVTIVADGIDLTTTAIHGSANNTTGTIGGLALVLNQGQLSQVAESFITRDGVSVKLGCDQAESFTLPYDINLELNGHNIAAVNTNGTTLTVQDAATDDFVGETYGTIPATVSYQAAENYLPVEENGTVSFHRYALKLKTVTLRPGSAGVYYKTFIAGDQKVKEQVTEFGIAMKNGTPPTQEDIMADTQGKTHVSCDGSSWVTGSKGTGFNSVLVQNIMKTDLTADENAQRAKTDVYGVAYMTLKDGTTLFGEPYGVSLQRLVERIDKEYPQLINSDMAQMYEAYRDTMTDWYIPNIKAN